MTLAKDSDLLFYEPMLLKECRSQGVRLAVGVGTVSGTSLVCTTIDFSSSEVFGSGVVVYFPAWEVGAVVRGVASVNELEVSQASAYLGNEGEDNLFGLPYGINQSFEIYTFPQLRAASERVAGLLGVASVVGEGGEGVRNAACEAALGSIFRSMAVFDRTVYNDGGTGPSFTPNDRYWKLAEFYEQRYRQTLRGARVVLEDADGDGVADRVVSGVVTEIRRE